MKLYISTLEETSPSFHPLTTTNKLSWTITTSNDGPKILFSQFLHSHLTGSKSSWIPSLPNTHTVSSSTDWDAELSKLELEERETLDPKESLEFADPVELADFLRFSCGGIIFVPAVSVIRRRQSLMSRTTWDLAKMLRRNWNIRDLELTSMMV